MYNKYIEYRERTKFIKRKRGMTIIVGIVFNGGVVLASDGQTSIRDKAKRTNSVDKIREISSKNKIKYNFGGSGETWLLARARESLKLKIDEKKKIEKSLEYADICEDVILDLQNRYIIDRNLKLNILKKDELEEKLNSEEWKKELQSLKLDFFTSVLILGDKEVKLYKITPDGYSQPIETYDAVGSGWGVSEYILSKFFTKKMQMKEAINIALTAVGGAKSLDLGCGGGFSISILTTKGFISKEDKNKYIKEYSEIKNKLEIKKDEIKAILKNE